MNFDIFIIVYPNLSKTFHLPPPFFLSDENVIIHLLTKTNFSCTCAHQNLVGDLRSQ